MMMLFLCFLWCWGLSPQPHMLGRHSPLSCLQPSFSLLLTPVFSSPSCPGDNPMIPAENIEDLVEHMVMVHQSVGEFSKQFQQKLRRSNYVTPKNYLDFINTYLKLLDEKTQYNIGEQGGTGCRA